MSTIGEEKRHNIFIAGKGRQQFIDTLDEPDNLLPRQQDRREDVVRANRACGDVNMLSGVPASTAAPPLTRVSSRHIGR